MPVTIFDFLQIPRLFYGFRLACYISFYMVGFVDKPVQGIFCSQSSDTGHYGLSAHLKRTGISDTSLCECGQADQTPNHVLKSYPKNTERPQLTWPHCADLATKLWGSAEDLYRTAGFCGINRTEDLTCTAVDR